MSLSTFVERPDVKAYLRENVTKPWFEVHAEIKAPPLTTSYGWTGTAFDYAMRFYLQKLNSCAKAQRWLAEESAAMVAASRESARTKRARPGATPRPIFRSAPVDTFAHA